MDMKKPLFDDVLFLIHEDPDMKRINEKIITSIMLCDPITKKGKDYLKKLDLKITPEYYYEHLRVKSKFETSYYYEWDDDSEDEILEKKETQEKQYNEIRREYDKFMHRFISDDPGTCPLLLVGVAGNGKTIEINRQLWMMKRDKRCDYLYFDLEEVDKEPFHAKIFHCPNPDNPIWLFCTKLLDGIMRYLLANTDKCIKIYDVFTSRLNCKPVYLADVAHEELFQNIKTLSSESPEAVRAVFTSLISFIDYNDPSVSTSNVLRILMYVVYCSNPDQKHYIVFDNIESFIKINSKNIQIPDGSLSELYSRIKYTTKSVVTQFDKISPDSGWKAFKIIVVVRRTSLDLLEPRHVQTVAIPKENIADLTGHFQIDDIWEKKTKSIDGSKCVWEMIKNAFIPDENNERIMTLANIIVTHRKNAIGWSYQSMIAPLMSHGIRRNAKAQAHAIMCTYKQLTSDPSFTIGYDTFLILYNNSQCVGGGKISQVRYMMRRALIEYQFKWAIYHLEEDCGSNYDDSNRWPELGIGHLKCDKNGAKIQNKSSEYLPSVKLSEVSYYDVNNITLLRRILTYLSYHLDKNSRIGGFGEKTVVEMFKTISLYELIKGVLLDPVQRDRVNEGLCVTLKEGQLRPFARVLLALSNMSNVETKSAPYVILNINKKDFGAGTTPDTFARILKMIWDKGEEESTDGEYNCHFFGARITDAGHEFLLKWLPSFSFMASLYCYDIPPLFFLKDSSRIMHVIKTVYDSATDLCIKYRSEASAFCDNLNDLKDKMYLPRIKEKEVTFPNHIKDTHINHLYLYKNYVEQNYEALGLKNSEKRKLISYVERYIKKYRCLSPSGGDELCF